MELQTYWFNTHSWENTGTCNKVYDMKTSGIIM